MDLPYPSQHDVNFSSNLNRIDKLRRSIKLSHNQLPFPQIQQLRKNQKQKITKFLTYDYGYNLSAFLQKNSIRLNAQIGTAGSMWNILHFACKFNAVQCLQYLLKEQYNAFPQEYEQFINLKTTQGYTALVICIINEANQALSLMLGYGGVDIHLIDSKKMTAYEVAINYNNEKAIKMLMNFQHQSKKSKRINKQKLSQTITFTRQQSSCCSGLLNYLISCMSFGSYPMQSTISCLDNIQTPPNNQIKNSKLKNHLFLSKDFYIDVIQIGKPEDQYQYQITWKKIQEIITNKKYPLYDSYNPFDICENNLVIKNNLILMQCISQHPWLVRKIVQTNKSRNNFYTANFYINYEQVKINIDHHVPFLKDRSQPMFISNHNQMWPMLLQKGLAKIHNGYFNLEQVSPKLLIQQMTGFPTYQIDIQHYSSETQNKVINLLQQLTKKGYFFILQGKEGSNLSNEGRVDCFSVLNFFDKGDKKLILVNCPFVDQKWRQKQKYQILALKLIKSHINKHNQMCVWIDEEKIAEYFSKIIVSTTLPNFQRTSLKIKLKENEFYFTFKIDKQRQQNLILQLVQLDKNKVMQVLQVKGFINQGMSNIKLKNGVQGQSYSYGIKNIQNVPGQYLCCIKFLDSQCSSNSPSSSEIQLKKQTKSYRNYMLIFWSIDGVQPIHIDQMLGPIQYLQCYKLNMIKYWQGDQKYQIQVASGHAIIIAKSTKQTKSVLMEIPILNLDIVQGNLTPQNKIELIKDQIFAYSGQAYFYCVLRGIDQSTIKKYKEQKKINFFAQEK